MNTHNAEKSQDSQEVSDVSKKNVQGQQEATKGEDFSTSERLEDKETVLSETQELKQTIQELTLTAQRLQAEFENYKRRTDGEKVQLIQRANERLLVSLIPVVENFYRALAHDDSEGLRHLFSNFWQVLEESGMRRMTSLDKQFDPKQHEALLSASTHVEQDDMKIAEVFEEGYLLHDAVIKHAKVKVYKFTQ